MQEHDNDSKLEGRANVATTIRVELEDATKQGAESIQRSLQKITDPAQLAEFADQITTVSNRLTKLGEQLGDIDGPETSQLRRDLSEVEKRLAALRKATQNRLELDFDDALNNVRGQVERLTAFVEAKFGEIRAAGDAAAESLRQIEQPLEPQVDLSALEAASQRINDILRAAQEPVSAFKRR